jgi:hypothetical protein
MAPWTVTHYLTAFAMVAALTLGAVALHYEALRLISTLRPGRWAGKVHFGAMIVYLIVAHCLEAILFAAGYWLGERVLAIGRFAGDGVLAPFHYVYFSLETYTTQSPGDIYAQGPLRLIAATEPLVGLILIGWSTSFTFIYMRRDWRGWGDWRSPGGGGES